MPLLTNVKNTQKQFWLIIALCLPVTIACIDLMGLSVAIDNIMHDFSASVEKTQWLLSGYTIGTAAFLITIGRMADIYGRRKLLLLGVLLFGISSLFAALSHSINFLISFRFAQGVASSIMMTTVVSIITHHFSPAERGSVISKWGFSLGLGMATGPLVGGVLIYFLNWRAIFAINIPICLLSAFLIMRLLPESKDETSNLKIDWLETILLTVTMIVFVTILSQGNNWGWLSPQTIKFFVASVILSTIFFLLERKNNNPLIDFSLFILPNFSAAVICGFLSYFCMYAWLFVFSVYLQNTYALTTLKAGIVLSSFSIAFAFSSRVLSKIIHKSSNKVLMQIGFVLSMLVFLWMTTITLQTHLWELVIMFFLLGVGITIINAPSITTATENVPPNKAGIASGSIFTIRWLGGSIGIVIITIVYQSGLATACLTLAFVALTGLFCTLLLKSKKRS